MEKDAAIFEWIRLEKQRQEENLELIASENYVSEEVMKAAGSVLTNKYAEGYPCHRYYGGCEYVDKIEHLARQRACILFGADHANVQPHSGSQANMAAYAALLNIGDKILSPSMNGGGHLTHSSPVSFVSKLYHVVTYDVDNTGRYDMNTIREIAKKEKPKLIVAGASAYPRILDFAAFRSIADEVGAYLMVDMAHIAGLVAGGVHPSPVPYADIVTTTTHKTLRGPRGGMILCRKEHATAVDKAIFPQTQGGGLQHIVAAKAVCLWEALQPEFKVYARQIVKNSVELAKCLRTCDIPLVTDGTDNHLMLLDLRDYPYTGKQVEQMLDAVCITVNKNMVPGDKRKPSETSGIRIGTAAVTTRGMKEDDMHFIADCIYHVIQGNEDQHEIRKRVQEFTRMFPVYLNG